MGVSVRQGVLMQFADARKVIPFVVLVATASTAQTQLSQTQMRIAMKMHLRANQNIQKLKTFLKLK